VQNYNNLAEYTIFLQGNPFDHSPDIVSTLQKCVQNPFYLSSKKTKFAFISQVHVDTNLSGCPVHPNLAETLQNVYAHIFHKRLTDKKFTFAIGAQFVVSKARILSRSRAFYQNIVHLLDHHIHPIEGYAIERFHRLIFMGENEQEHEYKTQKIRQMQLIVR